MCWKAIGIVDTNNFPTCVMFPIDASGIAAATGLTPSGSNTCVQMALGVLLWLLLKRSELCKANRHND